MSANLRLGASRRAFLLGPSLGVALASGQQAVGRRPNVVLILADNLGYGDAGCYGGIIRTPNVDRLATSGVRFTNAYSTTMCSPSRAMLMTGRYAERSGLPSVIWQSDLEKGLPRSEVTLADLFAQAGYKTGCFGKWHLGHGPDFVATKRGFDEFFGIPYSLDMPPCPLLDMTSVVQAEVDLETLPARITERAIQFVEDNHDHPFFLYLPHTSPHPPLRASSAFRGKSAGGVYGDVVEEMDSGIGRVLETLHRKGLDENTIVIFTSDNGTYGTLGSAGGLRGVSYHTFEGAVRIPFIVRWPGRVPSGRSCDTAISLLDILPTLASLCSLQQPAQLLDGIDISSLLVRPDTTLKREPLLYFDHMYNVQCARLERFKLHISRHDLVSMFGPPFRQLTNLPLQPPELYDLSVDPRECYDVGDRHPNVIRTIQDRVAKLVQGMPLAVQRAYAETHARKTLPQEQGRRIIRTAAN